MVPPAPDQTQQEELKEAAEQPRAAADIQLANWYWKMVRQFVSERFGISLCSSSSCNYWLHRLGFAFKRPKKRLVKAGHLGQCPGPSWGGGAGVPQDAPAGVAAGQPAGLQPGLQRR